MFLCLPLVGAAAPAQPSCAQVICLSPRDGQPAPQACFAVRARYFSIRIYNPSYDPGATAQARKAFLETCATANAADIGKITQKYGALHDDPRSF